MTSGHTQLPPPHPNPPPQGWRELVLPTIGALISSSLILSTIWLLLITPTTPQHTLQVTHWQGSPDAPRSDLASEWIFYPVIATGEAAWAQLAPLDAADYPILMVNIDGRTAGTEIAILWRTAARPNAINQYPLPWAATTKSALNLNSVRQWAGKIINVGIAVGGRATGAITIRDLTLQSYSALSAWQLIWTAATSFESFQPYSINFLHGGLPLDNTITGTLIIAAWIILAIILNLIWQWLLNNKQRTPSLVIIFLTGWILLDIRWQLNLIRQHEITQYEYAGQSALAKNLNGKNGPLFRFLTSAKELLPPTPQRILLIPSDQDIYQAKLQRASFYLRPHNVYSIDTKPWCQNKLRPGDYVLALGKPKMLRYTANRLHWDGCNSLAQPNATEFVAERIANTAIGQLFLIQP